MQDLNSAWNMHLCDETKAELLAHFSQLLFCLFTPLGLWDEYENGEEKRKSNVIDIVQVKKNASEEMFPRRKVHRNYVSR